ncbi:MAG: outer membrane lipoprotein carrier protein LolA [Desulfobacterales bacterium]|nr:outer membrane lipoprotein carrier protein LolA [Desulfobacterales bacterium]
MNLLSVTRFKGLFLVTLLAVLTFGGVSPASTEGTAQKSSLLAGLEAKYANRGFSADFNQAARLVALDITETATGKAWFTHPGKMRWLYEAPDRHEIITDGQLMWIYRPDENQVMRGSAAPFFESGAGGAFLSDITRIQKDFSIALGKSEDSFAQLILTPKKETQDLAAIYITIALPSHEIQVVETENIYGDTTRFVFTNIRFTPPDPAMFHFTIPDGVSVIEMN